MATRFIPPLFQSSDRQQVPTQLKHPPEPRPQQRQFTPVILIPAQTTRRTVWNAVNARIAMVNLQVSLVGLRGLAEAPIQLQNHVTTTPKAITYVWPAMMKMKK